MERGIRAKIAVRKFAVYFRTLKINELKEYFRTFLSAKLCGLVRNYYFCHAYQLQTMLSTFHSKNTLRREDAIPT
jgi:hypothetical protein